MERKLTYVAEKNNQQCLTERDEVSIFNYEHLHFLVKRPSLSLLVKRGGIVPATVARRINAKVIGETFEGKALSLHLPRNRR